MTDYDKACLSDTARWATALRMQEICGMLSGPNPESPPEGLHCVDGTVRMGDLAILSPVPPVLRCTPKVEGGCQQLPDPLSMAEQPR
jgi:hypothetical protein